MARGKSRIAIIGAGFIGDLHVKAYKHVPQAEVIAVVDKREDIAAVLAEQLNAKTYTSLAEVLSREELDVVDICLPTTLHRDSVLEALEAGKDVLVEKPFALSLDDVDTMIAATKQYKRRLMVAHSCRFKPPYVYAKELIDSGRFGRALYFGAFRQSETPTWSWNQWLHDRSLSGGTVFDLQIHDTDISNWFLGIPESFYAQEIVRPGQPGPSHVVSHLTYPGGVYSVLETTHLMPAGYPFVSGFKLVMEHGAVECTLRVGKDLEMYLYTDGNTEQIVESDLPPMVGNVSYGEELHQFLACLKTGEPFRISLEEARLAVEAARKLMESLDNGRIVTPGN